ncbi:tripartite tricarboxylate transporter substrate binding protein [Nocardioides cavernae]|uniref:Tripartite tricarboxylate transporter substrate binding protein n=1 Tax=Nocardioides cavernae TaxID=1921566 RepID=A0ABR8N7V6_9ACTN|nr:tripartite tricarboxylate transporter substrate binding protein [Nocardioides cavernae]MBD3924234.1 tripartite tricarboxylate transporter substrate binding protein [Nocardioides cavernae]MBM7510827.1 tripartite-type tricarboxylate transporter receptor subunit TctC [Nocardioides cavernae]
MKLRRSMCVLLAAPLILTGCANTNSGGDTDTASFPEGLDSIQMIVPFSAGGSTDTIARLVAPRLEESLGVPVQVINREESGGQTGLKQIADSPKDGSVIGSANLPSIFTTYLDPNTDVDYDRDSFQTAGAVTTFGSVVVVREDSGLKTLDDLAAAASAEPKALDLAGGAVDDLIPITQLEDAFDAEFNLIPFEGGSADKVTALLGDKVDVIVAAPSAVVANVESGEFRVLATMGSERSVSFPDVSTAQELGYDITYDTVNGFALPAGTPDNIVEAYSDALSDVVDDPAFAEAVEPLGFNASYVSAGDYGDLWDERETEAGPIIEAAE